jgi:hypothetical protein
MAEKNQTVTLTVEGYTAEGLGVGRTEEGMAVLSPAPPGATGWRRCWSR